MNYDNFHCYINASKNKKKSLVFEGSNENYYDLRKKNIPIKFNWVFNLSQEYKINESDFTVSSKWFYR